MEKWSSSQGTRFPILEPLSGSKVDFYPEEVDQMSFRTSWRIIGKKQTVSL